MRSTCVARGGVCPGDRTDDAEVLEQSDALRPSEIGLWPNQPIGSTDGDPGLAGLQHHHHGVDVRDGDTRVLAKTPRKQAQPIKTRLLGTTFPQLGNVWIFSASD